MSNDGYLRRYHKTTTSAVILGVKNLGVEMGKTNVWSSMSCDPGLGTVFLPVTAPTRHFYGGHRHGDNLFGTSLVAVDVKTGKRKWHFQIVHHDVWDYDLPAAPVLAHMQRDGKQIDIVVQVTKTESRLSLTGARVNLSGPLKNARCHRVSWLENKRHLLNLSLLGHRHSSCKV